jgi:hypothetical protein
MAIVQNPITGRTKKKFGTAVFSKQFGKNTMRTKPMDVRNPKTHLQKQQRNKFSILVELARLLMGFIRVTFKQVAVGMSQYNAFVQTNISTAISGAFPNFIIDYSLLIVSKGTLKGVFNGAINSDPGQQLFITWDDNSDNGTGLPTDNAVILVINETKKAIFTDLTSATRADGNIVLTVPSSWVNDTVHVYLSFKLPVQDKTSDSTFIGTVAIQP